MHETQNAKRSNKAYGKSQLITGEDPKVTNSFQEPDNVQLATEQLQVEGNVFTHSFPVCSVTVLELQLQ